MSRIGDLESRVEELEKERDRSVEYARQLEIRLSWMACRLAVLEGDDDG